MPFTPPAPGSIAGLLVPQISAPTTDSPNEPSTIGGTSLDMSGTCRRTPEAPGLLDDGRRQLGHTDATIPAPDERFTLDHPNSRSDGSHLTAMPPSIKGHYPPCRTGLSEARALEAASPHCRHSRGISCPYGLHSCLKPYWGPLSWTHIAFTRPPS